MTAHPFLQAGDFNVRLSIERPVETPDGHGGHERSWEIAGEAWARIVPVGGIVFNRGAGDGYEITHWIYLRTGHGVLPGMRLAKGLRRFVVRGATDPDETGRYKFCECVEEREDLL